jgi:hypothetical protein
MVKDFFGQFGFERSADADSAEGIEWRLETARYVPREVFIFERTGAADRGTQ